MLILAFAYKDLIQNNENQKKKTHTTISQFLLVYMLIMGL